MRNRNIGPYGHFVREIGRRTLSSLTDLTFLFYLFLGVLLFGAIGVWSEVIANLLGGLWQWDKVLQALSTYYPALIGAACIQLILEANGAEKRIFDRPMTVVSLFLLIGATVTGFLIRLFEANNTYLEFCFWGTIALSVFGLWVWAIANCDNPDLKTDPYAASGGKTNRALKGNIEGFKAD